ncbi:C1 family peptidase [Fluviispira multicolorata]|uniref:Peptidase C1A papain C-terminal domain-containing protein n=1 Tax=Fluviispira multicolorata TaxID=2654512 RepID=A0A833N4I6_9BACT|nr:C1 family peptidase [Fluviispira multicolorata]KAB8030861.1 hypothetical protein GCL57_07760 [Fluviispira multicolorata]
MFRKINSCFIFTVFFFMCLSSYGQENNSAFVTIDGTQEFEIRVDKEVIINNDSIEIIPEEILKFRFLKIKPTHAMLEQNRIANLEIEKMGENDYRDGIIPFSESQGAIDLSMNQVPVLNQGADGTCVTFAVTAALDAKDKLGDYIDQQCALALARGLNMNLWNGTFAKIVLNMIWKNGYIKKGSCFGSTYPNSRQVVNPQKYRDMSDKRYSENMTWYYEKRGNIEALKNAIDRGYRVLLGIDIPQLNGFNVKINGKNYNGGLWACQQGNSRNYCSMSGIGHEVLAYGYDDKQKLIKIRNSWGQRLGESGDFYMTYNFLNAMTWDQITLLN